MNQRTDASGVPAGLTNIAPDPVTDVARLTEIGRYDLESPALKASLDTFATEAASLLQLPIGVVSIVLGGAQLFAGSHGLDGTWLAEAGGTPVEWSFCANAVRSGEPYVVEDAENDVLQSDNPLVLFDGIRSYAGAPLITRSGHALGACCTIGGEPREFTADEVKGLQGLAERIVLEIEGYVLD